jgi:hypothetical protein
MKKSPYKVLVLFLTLLLSVLLLCACPLLNDDTDPQQGNGQEEEDQGEPTKEPEEETPEEDQTNFIDTDVGTRERFWACNIQTGAYYQISAALLAESDECLVYAECNAAGNPAVEIAKAEEIAREYAKNIHTQICGAFGEIRHITPKNKVTFLLLDIKDGYSPTNGGGYVAGYFAPEDMEGSYISNRRDMLYIDINPGLMEMEALYSTVAHELQHLINYSNTFLKTGREPDLWINEGLSTAAEYIYGGDPASRVQLYNIDYGGTIQYGNNFFVWYGHWELDSRYGDSLANYSTAYLFFQWLRLHANNGTGIYKDIINSSYTDYRAVTQGARTRIPTLGLTGAPETDWEILLRTWMLSNALQNPTGLLGYQDKIAEITRGKAARLETRYFIETARTSWDFYPGEGIFSRVDSSPYTPPVGSGLHIKYQGFSKGGPVDLVPPYEGQFLLTLNANPDNRVLNASQTALLPGAGETGYLASTLAAASGRAAAGTAGGETFSGARLSREPAGPFSYPVDAGFLREKQRWETGPAAPGGVIPPGEE